MKGAITGDVWANTIKPPNIIKTTIKENKKSVVVKHEMHKEEKLNNTPTLKNSFLEKQRKTIPSIKLTTARLSGLDTGVFKIYDAGSEVNGILTLLSQLQ